MEDKWSYSYHVSFVCLPYHRSCAKNFYHFIAPHIQVWFCIFCSYFPCSGFAFFALAFLALACFYTSPWSDSAFHSCCKSGCMLGIALVDVMFHSIYNVVHYASGPLPPAWMCADQYLIFFSFFSQYQTLCSLLDCPIQPFAIMMILFFLTMKAQANL